MKTLTATLALLFLILVVVFGPFLSIWSLNTLFGLAIPFTFKTWLAMLLAGAFFHRQSQSSK